jgi:hypothetical protein
LSLKADRVFYRQNQLFSGNLGAYRETTNGRPKVEHTDTRASTHARRVRIVSSASEFKNVIGERVRLARLAMRPPASQEDLSSRLAARGVQNHANWNSQVGKPPAVRDGLRGARIAKALKVSVHMAIRRIEKYSIAAEAKPLADVWRKGR